MAKVIIATFDRAKWMDLALETNTADYILGHPRLLRSLSWNDDDYPECVVRVVPVVLSGFPPPVPPGQELRNLEAVERVTQLRTWLQASDRLLYGQLYGEAAVDADSIELDELQETAKELGIEDVDLHAARIRRGLQDDPHQAMGSSKELLESVLKAILGLHGNGPETRLRMPQLIAQVNEQLGLSPGGIRADDPEAAPRRKVLGALTTIVNSSAELRNAGFGSGHGGSRQPHLDVTMARLAISAAVTAATFYVETYKTAEKHEHGNG